MTENALAVRTEPTAVLLSEQQLNFISKTEFVPAALRGNLPAIMACVATGRALGIPDMVALRSINIIDGKATFSAELMVQLVRQHGHSITGEVDDEKATITGRRADSGDTMTVTWTLKMAERAGLLGKQNWKRYPEAMLWARAASQLCRMLFADCFAGATYTGEEIDDAELIAFDDSGLEPSEAPGSALSAAADPSPERPSGPEYSPATQAQIRKLNVLVGTLREAGHITTEQIYKALDRDTSIGFVEADNFLNLHWSPLRDSLSKDEASQLIERLAALEERVVA
jgi:hypothetical protein